MKAKAKDLQAQVDKGEETTINVDKFIALAKKYTEIQELTPTILNVFVGKIKIHAPDNCEVLLT